MADTAELFLVSDSAFSPNVEELTAITDALCRVLARHGGTRSRRAPAECCAATIRSPTTIRVASDHPEFCKGAEQALRSVPPPKFKVHGARHFTICPADPAEACAAVILPKPAFNGGNGAPTGNQPSNQTKPIVVQRYVHAAGVCFRLHLTATPGPRRALERLRKLNLAMTLSQHRLHKQGSHQYHV